MTDKRIVQKLATLRQALSSADSAESGSFAAVFNAFLDIAEDPALIGSSKPATDPVFKAALEAPVRAILGDETIQLQAVRILRCAGAGFLHGGFFAGSTMGTCFYFEADKQGLVALNGGGALTHFGRITVTELPKGTMLMPRPKGIQ